jgi:single-stranded DNA-specific DHH superfamily exonuclease
LQYINVYSYLRLFGPENNVNCPSNVRKGLGLSKALLPSRELEIACSWRTSSLNGVAGCDIIDFDVAATYWHTPQDTLDKVDPRSLAMVGHVFVETLPALEKKFH